MGALGHCFLPKKSGIHLRQREISVHTQSLPNAMESFKLLQLPGERKRYIFSLKKKKVQIYVMISSTVYMVNIEEL